MTLNKTVNKLSSRFLNSVFSSIKILVSLHHMIYNSIRNMIYTASKWPDQIKSVMLNKTKNCCHDYCHSCFWRLLTLSLMFSLKSFNDLHGSQSVFRISDFQIFTFIQVVHTELIKVVRTEHSTFKSLNNMSEEQAAVAMIIALTSRKNKSRKKGRNKKSPGKSLA